MPLSGETTNNRRGTRSSTHHCEHDHSMLVVGADTGYYARCLRCLIAGPKRPSAEAARQGLRVLGARPSSGG